MKKSKKLLSLVLAVLLCVGMLPTFSLTAFAVTSETKNIMLGTSGISTWNATDGYDYIYYGIDGESPIKWRVLDTKTNTNADGIFVLSESLFGTGTYGEVYFDTTDPYSNVYQGSVAQNWCSNFYGNKFSTAEQNEILATTKSDGEFTSSTYSVPFSVSDNILNGDKVFFLSAEETENSAYGFVNDTARVATYGTSAGGWWLRSPSAYYSSYAGYVQSDGYVYGFSVSGGWAARPAFNLDKSKVLFTAETKNAVVSNELSGVSDYTRNGWDITLLDNSRTFDVTETAITAAQGEEIELTYSGATIGENEYVSAMVVDSNSNVLYYGQIANNSESGTANLTIPSGLAAGNYTLKVFSEQLNGDKKTDYASDFVDIALTVEAPHNHNGITYTKWTDSTKLPDRTVSGHYCLETDVDIDSMWNVLGAEISICLNGHTIDVGTKGSLSTNNHETNPNMRGTLNIYDCVGTGKITGNKEAVAATIGNSYILNIYGGTIEGNVFSSSACAASRAKITIDGATIKGTRSVYARGYTDVYMLSGTVSSTDYYGISSYGESGYDNEVHIYGGKVEGIGAGEDAQAIFGKHTNIYLSGSPYIKGGSNRDFYGDITYIFTIFPHKKGDTSAIYTGEPLYLGADSTRRTGILVNGSEDTSLYLPARTMNNVVIQAENGNIVFHKHIWNIQLENNDTILKAVCESNDGTTCQVTDTTLSLNAPSLTIFGGTGDGIVTASAATFIGKPVDATKVVYTKNTEILNAPPTDAGDYAAYINVENKNVFVYYTIAKATVTVPMVASKVYDGTNLTADISNTERYTVKENNGGTDFGEYDVVLELIDFDNYKWENADTKTATIKFNITADTNEWTVTPAISDWTYGHASNPQGAAKYGTVEFSYYDSNKTALSEKPTNAGSYYMTAQVAASGNNYDILKTDYIPFVINKKDISGAVVELDNSLTYTGTIQTQNIKPFTVDGLNVTYDISGNTATDVGASDYTLSVTGNGNFTGIISKDWNIAKAAPTITEPTASRVLRGNALSTSTLTGGAAKGVDGTTDITGTFEWKDGTEVMNADGTEQKTVVFTPDGTFTNYKACEFLVDVEVCTQSSGGGGGGVTRYTVKFDTDGAEQIKSVTVNRNGKVTEPTEPTKDGYVFDGWYLDKDLTEKYDFETSVTKSFTLYAKWIEDEEQTQPIEPDVEPTEWQNPFTDVDTNDWYYENVQFAYENGFMKGTTEIKFAPNTPVTRGMFITILYRLEGEPAVNRSIPFADVKATDYFSNAVIWGQQNGIIKGISETEYAPDENITREQMAAILYRYAQFKQYDVSIGESTNILSYTDFDKISEYAISAIQWACGEGIISGKGNGVLDPTGNATRAEAAAMLTRLLDKIK